MPIEQNLPLPPIDTNLEINNSKPNCKVIFTIFAGRQRYLRTLFNYLNVLIKQDIITEVHLWDFTREHIDFEYMKEYIKTNPKYRILNTYRRPMPGPWNDYYTFYNSMDYDPNDIIIKCDDDVLYIDLDNFCGFLNSVKPNGLYYPNIVNNDVCAYIQRSYNIHDLIKDDEILHDYYNNHKPLTGEDTNIAWFQKYEKARDIHRLFFEDKNRFKISVNDITWHGRISINLFAVRFSYLREALPMFIRHGDGDDEAFFSYGLYKFIHGSNHIVPFFTICHFSFGPQVRTPELDNEFCDKFYELSIQETQRFN